MSSSSKHFDSTKWRSQHENLLCLYILWFVCLLIVVDKHGVKSCPLKLIWGLFDCLLRENLMKGAFSANHVLLTKTVSLGINHRQDIEMKLSTCLPTLSQKQFLIWYVLYMEANSLFYTQYYTWNLTTEQAKMTNMKKFKNAF